MKYAVVVVAGILVGLVTETATANPPRIVRFSHGHNVIVERVLVPEYVPVQVNVPQYSVGAGLDLGPIVEELRLLRQTVQQLRAGGEITDLPPEPEYVGLVRTSCASCHGITPKGNKLSFFDSTGRFKEPTPEVLGSVISQVASGAMPKGLKMETGDRLRLISGLTTQPEATAKMPPSK
jgi:mono/diheme cytochrome c family protein